VGFKEAEAGSRDNKAASKDKEAEAGSRDNKAASKDKEEEASRDRGRDRWGGSNKEASSKAAGAQARGDSVDRRCRWGGRAATVSGAVVSCAVHSSVPFVYAAGMSHTGL
jgi:hypothetical protein